MTASPGTFGSMTPGHQHPINLRLEQESASTPDKGKIVMMGNIPGLRCPTCAAEGKEVWVIPGRRCGYCGTPVG
ncbi:unnamed protein product [Parascedosporium putredinis]|uniref:Uncharacterized protein n=1 Tax=Parascedosporium putredinis TaxID=1442378 RepID=A0A9P1M7E7_9PEZI|nr:unnamed protein product [Parascedosporium putredinis]CAI7988106.1 unnamed protein product [Parascedosporium putredinis]